MNLIDDILIQGGLPHRTNESRQMWDDLVLSKPPEEAGSLFTQGSCDVGIRAIEHVIANESLKNNQMNTPLRITLIACMTFFAWQ